MMFTNQVVIDEMLAETGPPPRGTKQSNRLTSKWTETAEEAFGVSGAKGRQGELFVKRAIESWGWYVTDNEEDYKSQVAGEDLWIQKPEWANAYSVDVKNNLNKFGSFYVEPKEWMNPKKRNHRFWHVNVDTGWMAWYSREDMQYYFKTRNITEGFWVAVKDKMPFDITRRKYNDK